MCECWLNVYSSNDKDVTDIIRDELTASGELSLENLDETPKELFDLCDFEVFELLSRAMTSLFYDWDRDKRHRYIYDYGYYGRESDYSYLCSLVNKDAEPLNLDACLTDKEIALIGKLPYRTYRELAEFGFEMMDEYGCVDRQSWRERHWGVQYDFDYIDVNDSYGEFDSLYFQLSFAEDLVERLSLSHPSMIFKLKTYEDMVGMTERYVYKAGELLEHNMITDEERAEAYAIACERLAV